MSESAKTYTGPGVWPTAPWFADVSDEWLSKSLETLHKRMEDLQRRNDETHEHIRERLVEVEVSTRVNGAKIALIAAGTGAGVGIGFEVARQLLGG